MYHNKEGALIRIEHVHKYTFLVFIALSGKVRFLCV